MKIKNLFLILLLATFGLGVRNVFAWIEPTTVPPGNNIYAPLNTSSFGQSKIGGLILNIGKATHGLIVSYGLVGIGTDNPESKLDVRGETKTDSLGVRGNANVGGKVTSTGLEVNSTTNGVLFPRMTTDQRNAITSPPEGLLIFNTETKQLEIYVNGAWKASGGSSSSGTPIGAIAFFNLDACPAGWEKLHEAKGRYIVGTLDGGTKGGTQGTALSNLENRPVGQHTHTASQPPHSHNVQIFWPNWGGSFDGWGWMNERTATTASAQPPITVDPAGSVAGTNAPYIQYLVCQKISNDGETTTTTTTTVDGGESYWKKFESYLYYNDGNVGIGTHTPTEKLEVYGSTKISGGDLKLVSGNLEAPNGNLKAGSGKELFFSDNGQIRSLDNNHRLLFRRSENKMEMREYGDIIFSPGATASNETAKFQMKADGSFCIGADCRKAWPVNTWWEYFNRYCPPSDCYCYNGYFLRASAPNGQIVTVSTVLINSIEYTCYSDW